MNGVNEERKKITKKIKKTTQTINVKIVMKTLNQN